MEADSNQDAGSNPSGSSRHDTTLTISVPAPDTDIYRYEATDPVLRLLVDDAHATYTIRELGRLTGFSHPAVRNAVETLAANGLVHVETEGNRKQVTVNPGRLSKPTDPVLRIPQSEFHAPVREAVERLHEALDDVKGIVVFGSVARGDADRRSDVDLWVLVDADRGTNQRRANEVAKALGDERFDGDRYEFQVLVESTRSALALDDRLDDVLASGITLHDSETLQRFKQEVTARAG
jgi:predicted nucleotidyltransferase